MAEYAGSTNNEIRDSDLLGVARQLIERKKKPAELKKLATQLGFSDSQWKDFTGAFREISDEKEKHKQGIFLMLLYWKKRKPTSREVQELKKALDELRIDTEGYFQITPAETGMATDLLEKTPRKCEECQRYFLNEKGLQIHHGTCQYESGSRYNVVGRMRRASVQNTRRVILGSESRPIDVTIPITSGQASQKETVHALQVQARKASTNTTFPSDKMAVIGVGLRFSKKQTLQSAECVTVTMPHCAIFTDQGDQATLNTVKLYRYHSPNNVWAEETLHSGDGYPKVNLLDERLVLKIKHLDEWWILSLTNSNNFKGKRLICTSFVPTEQKNDGRDCMDVCLRDDNGFVEDRRPLWKKGRDKELSVKLGRGSLVIKCYQGGKMIDGKEIEESQFWRFTQHLVTFKLPGIQAVSSPNITLKFRQGASELFDMAVSL